MPEEIDLSAPTASPEIPPARPLAMWQVCFQVMRHPSAASFTSLVENPGIRMERALLWLFVVTLVGMVVSYGMQGVSYAIFGPVTLIPGTTRTAPLNPGTYLTILAAMAVCGSPLNGVFAVVSVMFVSLADNVIAKTLGAKWNFKALVYFFCALDIPFMVASALVGILGGIPYIYPALMLALLVFMLYFLVLRVIAIKAAFQFGTGRALAALFLGGFLMWMVILMIVGLLFVLLLVGVVAARLMFPHMGNTGLL